MATELEDQLDAELAEANAEFAAAGNVEQEKGFWDAVGEAQLASAEMQQRPGWVSNLPKNIGAGAYKAALNALDTVDSIASAAGEAAAGVVESAAPGVGDLHAGTSLKELAPEFYDGAHTLADQMTADNTLSDDIVQGVAQFSIPFAGWMKALGGVGLLPGVVAEAVTAATSFGAHDGRLADLAQLGQQAEGKFGDVLRSIAPDGSLINSYINWMTDRENEGEWEGRFKNAVDSLAGTAAVAGLIKGAATGFKVGKQALEAPMKVGPSAQRGALGVQKAASGRALEHTVDNGEHRIVMPGIGEAALQEGDGVLQMRRIDVNEEARGTLAGMDMMLRAAQQAEEQGLRLTSDTMVSPSAQRLYEGMQRNGYVVKRNPASINPNTGSLVSADPRVPVFEVRRAYANVPDNLMGFRRAGPNKGFEETNFPKAVLVKVSWDDGQTMFEAMNGLNATHALERARRNWPTAYILRQGSDLYDARDVTALGKAIDALEVKE